MRKNWTITIVATAALVAAVTASRCGPDPGNPIPRECPRYNAMDRTIHLAHEWDCTKFYKCDWGERVLFNCPFMNAIKTKRLHFNPSLQVCDWPECAGCSKTNSDRVPYPNDCTKYYEIIDGKLVPKDCPHGLHFSASEKICMDPDKAGCRPNSGPCNGVANGLPVADERDCSKYYLCSNGIANPQKCPTGLHFSKTLQRCVAPEVACCNYTALEPYPGDCTRYYENVNCHKTPRDCPSGLHFSPTAKICMDPNTAGCRPTSGPCNGVANGLPVADERDCSKYYLCSNGIANPQKCPEGLHFSKTLQRCVAPEVACCNYTALEPYPGDCTKYYENVNCHKTPRNCPSGLHFSPTERICMDPNTAGCRPTSGPCDGVANGLPVADERDCNRYYLCNNGMANPQKCPEGLHFSKTLQRCVAPEVACCNYTALEPYPGDCTRYYENVNCHKTPRNCPSGLHFSPTKRICMDPNTAGCRPISGPCDGIANGLPVADERDCSKYYLCNNGMANPQKCPEGLHFSKTLQHCVAPEVACCNYTALEPYPGDCTRYYENINCHKTPRDCPRGLHFSPTEKICMDPNTAGCRPISGPCDGIANGLPVADERDCSKYYLCNNGMANPQKCPEGLHFSKTLQHCVAPEVACCNYTALEPYPGDCTRYYENINCYKTPRDCPRGLHFSPTEKICMDPIIAGCRPISGPCDGVANGLPAADERDCSKYYLCNNGMANPQECPDGLHFSKTLRRCVAPEVACCNYTALEPYPGDCTRYYENVNCNKTLRDCPRGLHFSPTQKICMDPNTAECRPTSGPCDGVPNGTPVGYDCDCGQFILCLNGDSILKNCPQGLHFSKILQKCVHPDIAQCNFTDVLPYPGDCSKYYAVINGTQVPKDCPTGLHFSPTEKKCMDPSEAGCQLAPCDGGIISGSQIPDKCYCNRYFLCHDGDLLMKNCPKGLHFSEALQRCVAPEIAGCTADDISGVHGDKSKTCENPTVLAKRRISNSKTKSKQNSHQSPVDKSHDPKSKSQKNGPTQK